MKRCAVFLLICGIILAACQPAAPVQVNTPTIASTATSIPPTNTPPPTDTATPTITPTITLTPLPPTPTNTPRPQLESSLGTLEVKGIEIGDRMPFGCTDFPGLFQFGSCEKAKDGYVVLTISLDSPDDASLDDIFNAAHGVYVSDANREQTQLYSAGHRSFNNDPDTTGLLTFTPKLSDSYTLHWGNNAEVVIKRVHEQKASIKIGEQIAVLAFSPDGNTLAAAKGRIFGFPYSGTAFDGRVTLIETGLIPLVKDTIKAHNDGISMMAFSPDGTLMLTGDGSGSMKVWDVAKKKVVHSFAVVPGEGYGSPAFSPDGAFLIASHKGNLVLISTTDWKTEETWNDSELFVNDLAFSTDGSKLVTGNSDHSISVWDAATRELLQTLSGHTEYLTGLSVSPDGAVVASASNDLTVVIWDAASGKPLFTIEKGRVDALAFSPDGTILASGGVDGLVKLWDPATGKLIRTLAGHLSGIYSLAFSPDGATLASGGDDGLVLLWDVGQ